GRETAANTPPGRCRKVQPCRAWIRSWGVLLNRPTVSSGYDIQCFAQRRRKNELAEGVIGKEADALTACAVTSVQLMLVQEISPVVQIGAVAVPGASRCLRPRSTAASSKA